MILDTYAPIARRWPRDGAALLILIGAAVCEKLAAAQNPEREAFIDKRAVD
jgi:hypothetical protein